MPRRPSPASRSAGFSLLETVVALVIFTGGALALYALFNSNLIALGRAHDVSRQLPAAYRAIEYLSAINPRDASTGQVEIDGLNLTWSARLLEPARQSQTSTGGMGYYEIGLYEVEFSLDAGGQPLGTWQMRISGYEKVRESSI